MNSRNPAMRPVPVVHLSVSSMSTKSKTIATALKVLLLLSVWAEINCCFHMTVPFSFVVLAAKRALKICRQP